EAMQQEKERDQEDFWSQQRSEWKANKQFLETAQRELKQQVRTSKKKLKGGGSGVVKKPRIA
ncbi:MAG: hypothetical protein AAGM67_20355, partial [Bacteroidota bacterium]